jgi:hypothetical protein
MVQPDLELPAAPPDRTLYAPTLQSPNRAGYESVTAYWRYEGMDSTSRAYGVWDHVAVDWAVFKYITACFLSLYVRDGCYLTIVMKYPEGWRVYLWNYSNECPDTCSPAPPIRDDTTCNQRRTEYT